MRLKKAISMTTAIVIGFMVSGCELTDEEKEKLNDAQIDLEQLADQIIITYPANYSVITEPTVTVRADIPSAAEAKEVTLYVDGVEVAKDDDGAPWEIVWPSYYWGDDGQHTLLLKTVTGGGNEVRNNQQYQVTVDSEVNKSLKFSDGLDGLKLKDSNSVTVEFDAFSDATGYEIQYTKDGNSSVISTIANSYEMKNLDVGQYEIQYRATCQFSGLTTLKGPWNDPVIVEVLPPDLPVVNQPLVTKTLSGYDVEFSWDGLGEGNTYTVFLKNLFASTDPIIVNSTNSTSLLVSNLELGNYEWQMKRTNPLGQDSLLTDPQQLDVGVFVKRFGGTDYDSAKQIIASKSGGYIILGSTNSYEVSESVDYQGDDWIMKVSGEGELVWQNISNVNGWARFKDMAELSDGSIIVVGADRNSKQAVAQKIDDSGKNVWEVLYKPEGVTERYDFLDVLELNNTIYVTSAAFGTEHTSYYLHTVSTTDGLVSDPISIPLIDGIKIDSVTELTATSLGDLMISGSALPDNTDPIDYYSYGAYLQVLDTNFTSKTAWNNVGKFRHGNVGDAIELSSGRFSIIGQSEMGTAISIINSDGTEYRNHIIDYDKEFYMGEQIVAGQNEEFYCLMKDSGTYSYPYPLTFMQFNSSLVVEEQKYLLNFKDYVESIGLVKNNDGTFTFLFIQEQDGANNYDIVVAKMKMD